MASPFVNIFKITLVIEKESDINMENFQVIAKGSKDNVTLLLCMLGFSGL